MICLQQQKGKGAEAAYLPLGLGMQFVCSWSIYHAILLSARDGHSKAESVLEAVQLHPQRRLNQKSSRPQPLLKVRGVTNRAQYRWSTPPFAEPRNC